MFEKSFAPIDLRDKLAETGMKGKNIVFLDDWTRKQLMSLFEAAAMLEPYSKNGLNLLEGKVLYNLFFQPSTRTRCSFEAAMGRMGGKVITDTDPMTKSAMAKGETLYDAVRVVSEYADVLVLRHGDDESVIAAVNELNGYCCPIISGGWGHVTHPTQGLLDLYSSWRFLGKSFEDMTIIISTPDLSRARSGQSFALGAAQMGAKVVYTGASELKTPQLIKDKLDTMGATYEEHFDLTHDQNVELMESCDLLYLPGSSLKKEDPNREDFLAKVRNHYLSLADLEGLKKKTGKSIGVMHSLPRNDFEMDKALDNTEFQLYFRTIGFSVPLRMALLGAIVGAN